MKWKSMNENFNEPRRLNAQWETYLCFLIFKSSGMSFRKNFGTGIVSLAIIETIQGYEACSALLPEIEQKIGRLIENI